MISAVDGVAFVLYQGTRARRSATSAGSWPAVAYQVIAMDWQARGRPSLFGQSIRWPWPSSTGVRHDLIRYSPATRPLAAVSRFPPGGPRLPRRPSRYAPHVVLVIVVVLAAIGPAGQVEVALFALAAVLPLLGPRGALR